MDGVIVAYHNTERMFGFQYIPLEEMDHRLFGPDPGTGDRVFDKCISILELVAEEIIRCFPQEVFGAFSLPHMCSYRCFSLSNAPLIPKRVQIS